MFIWNVNRRQFFLLSLLYTFSFVTNAGGNFQQKKNRMFSVKCGEEGTGIDICEVNKLMSYMEIIHFDMRKMVKGCLKYDMGTFR